MIVSDEQVRNALSIWFGQEDYARSLSHNASSMRFMRAALEAVAVETTAPWQPVQYHQHTRRHGLFSVFECGGLWHATRVLGYPEPMEELGKYDCSAAARAACDRRLAELSDGHESECLEASR